MIVELDGGKHYTQEGIRRDHDRDKYLESLGFTVLRFSDREVFKNIEGVHERIFGIYRNPPNPPLEKGGYEDVILPLEHFASGIFTLGGMVS